MGLTPAQIAQRLEGITATDVSAIVGLNPYRSRIDVWREKRGELPPWRDTERSRWGELLEPVVRADYATRHNLRIEVPGTLVHPDREWMMATPDGIAYAAGSADPDRGLEIKCHTWRVGHLYGAPGTDEIPLWELCQCSWNLAVTGLDRWDLCAFIDGQPTDYTIDRDDELLSGLTEQCQRFLVDNVRGGAVPEPDGSESFDGWLKARWAANPGALIDISEDGETFTLIERGRDLRERVADAESDLGKVVQQLKLKIGDHEGLTWKNARGKPEKVTWKRSKPSRTVDHAGIARDARDDARMALSGLGPTISRALICLESAGHTPIGHATRAAIDAHELHELVTTMSESLATIAARTDEKYTHEFPGKRPFNWPRTWKSPSDKEQQG